MLLWQRINIGTVGRQIWKECFFYRSAFLKVSSEDTGRAYCSEKIVFHGLVNVKLLALF